jgi:hypothetical protein
MIPKVAHAVSKQYVAQALEPGPPPRVCCAVRWSPVNAALKRCATVLKPLFVAALAMFPARAEPHDVERTQVLLWFARDGSFALDVSNDPAWLALRLERFGGNFLDRVVLFVDGHEIRPTSIEFIAPFDSPLTLSPSKGERLAQGRPVGGLATYRMRGRFPTHARTLRWYYGMVVDPYPLAIRRADGRVVVEEIAGDAWSGSIDLTGQFTPPLLSDRAVFGAITLLLIAPVAFRVRTWRRALALRSQP